MNAKQRREFEAEFQLAAARLLGPEPQLVTSERAVPRLDRWALWIDQSGAVVTRLAGELIQALAVLVLLVFFAALEFERVRRGALALDQSARASVLIALALVVANIVHPVYRLREHRAAGKVVERRGSLRLWLRAAWARLSALDYQVVERDQHYNPVLHLAAFVITWGTILFACYDLLRPIILEYGSSWSGLLGAFAIPGTALKFLAGVAASVGGVMFLQAASHEIGVRMVVSRPVSALDLHRQQLEDYNRRKVALIDQVRAEYLSRQVVEPVAMAALVQEPEPVQEVVSAWVPLSGNGHRNGNGHSPTG